MRGVLDHETGMSEENIAKFIAQYDQVNVYWLITGEGDMFKQDISPKHTNALQTPVFFQKEEESFLVKHFEKERERLEAKIDRLNIKIHELEKELEQQSNTVQSKNLQYAPKTEIKQGSGFKQKPQSKPSAGGAHK